MKKILYLLSSNIFSGAENVICTIINNLDNNYEAVYCSPFGPIEDIVKSKGIKYYGLKKLNLKYVKKIIEEYKPDIIHANDYKASLLASFTNFNGPIISHLHNNCPFAKKWNLKTITYTMASNKYTKIIGVSDKVYKEAIFKNKIKNKYSTMYNYIDKEDIAKKSNEFNYNKKYDLFFIGRLTEQKNPQKFIEIVNEVKKTYKNITAVMIGDGELKSECIRLIEKYNLEDNIELLGFSKNPFPIIKQCKIGIMPSKWEGFGLTAVESMILNKPVLNSGAGGLEEIFKNAKEFICNDGEYSKKIAELMKNKEFYNELVSKSNIIISNFVDKNKYKQNLNQIYS